MLVNEYPIEVIKSISETIDVLDDNYEENRSVDSDLGGYIIILENIVVIEMLKQDKLKGLTPECTDIIKFSEEVNCTSSLFLLSSDVAMMLV